MTASDLQSLLTQVEMIAREAGKAILEVYHSLRDYEVQTKADDSPVTRADLAAHQVIAARLPEVLPGCPLLSEEGGLPDYEVRRHWQRYWLVDPLDGTKEFIGKNGEFTVNIALIEAGVPVLGVVYAPVLDLMYAGVSGKGAWVSRGGATRPLRVVSVHRNQPLRVVASRRHGAQEVESMLKVAGTIYPEIVRVSMGSSLKICKIAEGEADWYPRLAPTSEWDTAAAQAVLEAAGGLLCDTHMQPLRYNGKESLLNPWFHAVGDVSVDWNHIIAAGSAHQSR